jgi:hypothetical protein
VLKGETTVERAVVVVVTVALWGITERVVIEVDLEFHMNVDERDVGYDAGVYDVPRYREKHRV